MNGTTLVILLLVTAVAAIGLSIAGVYINGSSTSTASLNGVLTVYPSGPNPSGNAASYNVTLSSKNGVGTLSLLHISGESDPVAVHSYPLSNVLVSPYNITMTISGYNVSLGWVTTSTIWSSLNATYGQSSGVDGTRLWKDLNSSYVAASGPENAPNATIGAFSPSVLHLPADYHMFIGLTIPNQPSNNIPIAEGRVSFAMTVNEAERVLAEVSTA